MTYSYRKKLTLSFEEVSNNLPIVLQNEWFGIVTTIDMQEKIQKKIHKDIWKYVIYGVCNPQLAYDALQLEHEVWLLLPCNIIVYEQDDELFISALLPTVAMKTIKKTSLDTIAQLAEQKIKNIIDRI